MCNVLEEIEKRPMVGRFSKIYYLDFADIEGVRSFWAVANFERDLVSLLKLIKCNVLELVGMEEKVFITTLDFNKAETLDIFCCYGSFLHTIDR